MKNFPKEVYATSIEEYKEFDRIGYHYTKIASGNNFYLFVMEKEGCNISYEVWKGKKRKQPDGSIVYTKPSDEDFGVYGWYIMNSGRDISFKKLKEKFPEFPLDQFKEAVNNCKK